MGKLISVLTIGCTLASCGDGVRLAQEACDDGNVANTDTCLNTCEAARCGDAYLWEDRQSLGG